MAFKSKLCIFSLLALASFTLLKRTNKVDIVHGRLLRTIRSHHRNVNDTPFLYAVERSIAIRRAIASQQCTTNEQGSSVFDAIYETSHWNPGAKNLSRVEPQSYYTYGDPEGLKGRASLSGIGSNIGSATDASIKFLAEVIQEYNVSSLLDIPCGDVKWQFESWEMDSLGVYVGADIVSSVIELNQQRFAHHLNKHFVVWDFSTCPLPSLAAVENMPAFFDLVHVRDVFQHLPLMKAAAAAKHIRESG